MKIFTPYLAYWNGALIVLAIALIASILMQARSAGLGSVFGGTGSVFKTKLRIEKFLYGATIVFGGLFVLLCLFVWAIPAQ
jgi:preprotein translocase subunit SecG